jgi:hypothetical protein
MSTEREIEMLSAIVKAAKAAGLYGTAVLASAKLEKLIDARITELAAELDEL